jgi:hypothetical protein
LPAARIVPDRVGPDVAATLKPTAPEPVPDDPSVIVIQSAPLDAVQGQPAPAETVIRPAPPDEPAENVAGAIEYAQPCDCVTPKRCPAIVRVDDRGGPSEGATS